MRLLTSPINRPARAPPRGRTLQQLFALLLVPLSLSRSSSFFLSHWSSIASINRTPTLAANVCELERTPVRCHPRRGLEKSFHSKVHPKWPEARCTKQPKQPLSYKHPQSLVQQPQKPKDLRSHWNNHQPKWRCSS
jgi:hypothetical protein